MAEVTLQALSDKLDNIAHITSIGVKTVLDLQDAATFTGLSIGHLYRLTSGRQIPHFKKNRKLYFKKTDLEEWMTGDRVLTDAEVQSRATTYTKTHRKKERPNL